MSEIAAAPRAVLQYHYPEVPLHGDFTTIHIDEYESIDLLVGGTPCQSFSVAGLRGGLADERGNLALEYLRLAERLRPRWLVWENVPGVRSSGSGRDFGAFLGSLGELGYGWAYRSLDAQYFGLAQRRERVFVVGYLGDWRPPAAVLFEPASLRWDSPPRREARERVADTLTVGANQCSGTRADFTEVANPLGAHRSGTHLDLDNEIYAVSYALNAHGGVGRMDGESETFVTASAQNQRNEVRQMDVAGANGMGIGDDSDPMFTLECRQPHGVGIGCAVRRLTPRECERLQGFPDDYTLIPYRGRPMADGPRYRLLGNSMAVPVVHWIGERITRMETARAA